MPIHRRLLALDGLRAVSILIVAFSHLLGAVGMPLIPGGFGVTVFFFISGFIITRLLLQERAETNQLNLVAFYLRRFFRLAPALLVYVAISCAVFGLLGLTIPRNDVLATLFYYANYHGIYHGFSIYRGFAAGGADGIFSPLAITWSLAVEEHFYFVFPIFLLAFRERTDRLLTALCVFVTAVTAWRLFLVFIVGLDAMPFFRIYMGTDTRLDSIAYGCILSVLFFRAQAEGDRKASKFVETMQGKAGLLVTAGLLLLSFVVRSADFRESLRYTVQGLALFPLFCALFWAGSAPQWLKLVLENRVMVFIGAISYSLYLYHFLALASAQWILRASAPIYQVALASVLAVVGSIFSYYLIEGPARRLGSRFAAQLGSSNALSKSVAALKK